MSAPRASRDSDITRSMLAVGSLTGIGLAVIGVPLARSLRLLMGLLAHRRAHPPQARSSLARR